MRDSYQPRPAQKDILAHRQGTMGVSAVPGSGKTWTLSLLAAELIRIRPDIPILLCTGFSDKLPEERAVALGIKGLLMKPIIRAELSAKIRKVLDDK